VAVATVVAVVTSEFTSNTASANMVVPVVIALARATGVDPLMAALAATFASSLGFMMPVSTPCNAIVYGSGRVPLRSMMASGAIIDVVGAITVTAAMLLASRF
jgi:sodium-dependent dicarboxylate transporter 2/3/5